MAECVRLDTELEWRSNSEEKYLPPSLLQKRLEEIETSAEYHDMKLKLSKSQVIPFNFTRKHQITPELFLGGTLLEVVKETKLLGLTISSSCNWDAKTK